MTAGGIDWTFTAMGTQWRIHHDGSVSGEDAQALAAEVGADERRWSRFLPGSDVAAINRSAGVWVAVDPSTAQLVEDARAWSLRTHGAFQPLVGQALAAWGYDRRLGDGDHAPLQTHAVPDAARIEVDGGRVRIPAGAALDLGGIGKSHAAARAGAALAARCDAERLIVDAGGDLAVIRGEDEVVTAAGRVVVRAGEGVATSSSERRRWALNGDGEAHHLIDPATGAPGPRGTAVVVGRDPVEADVLATCIVLEPSLLDGVAVPAARMGLDGVVAGNGAWTERFAPMRALSRPPHGDPASAEHPAAMPLADHHRPKGSA